MSILIDTSLLLASMFNKDQYHTQARRAMQELKGEAVRLMPSPVVYELFYMMTTRTTYERRDFSVFRPRHCAALELLP